MTQARRVRGLTDKWSLPFSPPVPKHFIRTHLWHLVLGPCPRKFRMPLLALLRTY